MEARTVQVVVVHMAWDMEWDVVLDILNVVFFLKLCNF